MAALDAAPPEWVTEQHAIAARAFVADDSRLGFELPWDYEIRTRALAEASGAAATGTADAASPPAATFLEKLRSGEAAKSFTSPFRRSSASTGSALPLPLTCVAGMDISFLKGTTTAVASLVVLSFPSMKVVHSVMHHCQMTVPYIAGFLAFREVEPLRATWRMLLDDIFLHKRLEPTCLPQIIFLDGNGVLHYRRCGLAAHLGVLLEEDLHSGRWGSTGLPSGVAVVGCAKECLNVDGLSRERVRHIFASVRYLAGLTCAERGAALAAGHFLPPGRCDSAEPPAGIDRDEVEATTMSEAELGSILAGVVEVRDDCNRQAFYSRPWLSAAGSAAAADAEGAVSCVDPNAVRHLLIPLRGRTGYLYGYAAMTGRSEAKPIYISAGHRVTALTASRLALTMATNRVIEPVRQADLRSRQYIRDAFPASAH